MNWETAMFGMAKKLLDSGRNAEAAACNRKAVNAYEKALKADPGYYEVYFNLGVLAFQMGHKGEGIRNMRKAISLNPLLHSAYGPLSDHYAGLKQWRDARDILEQAIRAFPEDEEFRNNLAFVYEQLGKDQKSLGAPHGIEK